MKLAIAIGYMEHFANVLNTNGDALSLHQKKETKKASPCVGLVFSVCLHFFRMPKIPREMTRPTSLPTCDIKFFVHLSIVESLELLDRFG